MTQDAVLFVTELLTSTAARSEMQRLSTPHHSQLHVRMMLY